jgi:hypothetical protein
MDVILMANDLFRDMVSIARQYLHPFLAENLIRKLCEQCGTSEDDVNTSHLPSIVLAIATDNSLYQKLKFHQYLNMMKKFMAFSNHCEEGDMEKAREFIRDSKTQKKDIKVQNSKI